MILKQMKILYLMWIDWKWIWQRPQILAQKLEKEYDVTVAFPQNIISRQKMQRKNAYPNKFRKIYVVPLYNKFPFLQRIMDWIIRWSLRDSKKYDIIWVGHPMFEKVIPKDYSGKVVYDCMDNHAALCADSEKERIVEEEIRLVERADIVFVTAQLLKEKIEKYVVSNNTRVVLVRNGYEQGNIYRPELAKRKEKYILGYIGTISEWMDYSIILQSIEEYKNIEYHMIGLVSGDAYVKNDKIYYEGVVEHKNLYNNIKDYDCLIMPFLVNDIVLSVDPVKLYEYISFGKCIVSVYYPEIERFGEYVYFYKTKDDYCKLMGWLIENGFPPKYTKEEQEEFLKNNTWEERFRVIRDELGELRKK